MKCMTFAPYFGEYRAYVTNYDGILKEVEPNTETFQPNLKKFEQMLSEKTKAVIVNTPNNPTGVVYSEADHSENGSDSGDKSRKNSVQASI